MKTPQDKISKNSFLLLAHYATFAYQDLLFEYLTKNKAQRVTKMNFPLPELPELKRLEITQTEKGKQTYFKKYFSLYRPPFFAYIFQSIQLFLLIFFSKKKYDVIIAEDSLLSGIGIFLRWSKKCKKVIFYSHGFDKSRFTIPLLNFLYQQLDTFSSRNSDFNWFLNKNMAKKRENQGIPKNKLFWMPASISINDVARNDTVFNHKIVFLGVTNKKNGAHILLDIVKKVKTKITDISLDVIGDGDMFHILQKNIITSDLKENINLLGMKQFKDFSQLLANYSIGIAPYEDRFDTLTASSDSMKMRVYLAAGLPVIITKGFIFSEEIEKNNLGFSVPFNTNSFADAIIKLLSDKEKTLKIRKRALEYSRDTDIYLLYNSTFNKIL